MYYYAWHDCCSQSWRLPRLPESGSEELCGEVGVQGRPPLTGFPKKMNILRYIGTDRISCTIHWLTQFIERVSAFFSYIHDRGSSDTRLCSFTGKVKLLPHFSFTFQWTLRTGRCREASLRENYPTDYEGKVTSEVISYLSHPHFPMNFIGSSELLMVLKPCHVFYWSQSRSVGLCQKVVRGGSRARCFAYFRTQLRSTCAPAILKLMRLYHWLIFVETFLSLPIIERERKI